MTKPASPEKIAELLELMLRAERLQEILDRHTAGQGDQDGPHSTPST